MAQLDPHKPLLPKVLDVLTSPWAILPEKLLEIQAIYATHLRGEKIDIAPIEAALGRTLDNERKPYDVQDGVALIPIEGIIAKKMNLMVRVSGGLSTQILQKDITQALADPSVQSLLLLVDSPGGTVDGTEEIADFIFSARGQKPIIAYTDGLMASAAYWIAAASDMIYVSGDTPWVGSIGVVTTHIDYSGWEQKTGIKTTEIYAGKYKRIDSEYNPLSPEGAAYLQGQVDHIYSIFANRMALYRPGKLSIPTEGAISWADGKIFIGKQAIDAGLVDGVSTRDRLIEKLSQDGATFTLRARVEAEIAQRAAQQQQKGGINGTHR